MRLLATSALLICTSVIFLKPIQANTIPLCKDGRVNPAHGLAEKEDLAAAIPLTDSEKIGENPAQIDPFQPMLRFASGKFRGERVNTDLMRSPIRLADSYYTALKVNPETHWLVANFVHNDRHWIASIPREAVRKVKIEKSTFFSHEFKRQKQDSPLAHLQAVFVLQKDAPLELVVDQIKLNGTQLNPNLQLNAEGEKLLSNHKEAKPIKITSLTVSFEALFPHSWNGNFMDDGNVVKGNFATAVRIGSTEQRHKENREVKEDSINQYFVDFEIHTPEGVKEYPNAENFFNNALEAHIRRASQDGIGNAFRENGQLHGAGKAYDLLCYSCTTWMNEMWMKFLPPESQATEAMIQEHLLSSTLNKEARILSLFEEPKRFLEEKGEEEMLQFFTQKYGEKFATTLLSASSLILEASEENVKIPEEARYFVNQDFAMAMPSFIQDVFFLNGYVDKDR